MRDSDCRNILYNFFKNLETRVTENFVLSNTTNENQIKGARQLEDLIDAVNFIRKKFEKIMKHKHGRKIKSLSHSGQVSALQNNFENSEVKLEKQEQNSHRNCLLIYGISENNDEDTDELVIKL